MLSPASSYNRLIRRKFDISAAAAEAAAGGDLQAHMAIGRLASAGRRREALSILDSLRRSIS
jgi:hypothetical protein